MFETFLVLCGWMAGVLSVFLGGAILVRALTVPLCQAVAQVVGQAAQDPANSQEKSGDEDPDAQESSRQRADAILRALNELQGDRDLPMGRPGPSSGYTTEGDPWAQERAVFQGNRTRTGKTGRKCGFCESVRQAVFGPKAHSDVSRATSREQSSDGAPAKSDHARTHD